MKILKIEQFINAYNTITNSKKVNKLYENTSSGLNSVSLVAVGDMLANEKVQTYSYINGNYNYDEMFSCLKTDIMNYDLRYCNSETPIVDNVTRGYGVNDIGNAVFSVDKSFGNAIINAGFNLISLSNNHVLDNGVDGMKQNKKFWDDSGIICCGMGKNDIENRIIFFEKNGIKFSFISYTTRVNGMSKKYVSNINLWDEQFCIRDIMYARNNSDVVIVSMHWGTEYMVGNIDSEQKHISVLLSQLGVNIIIGTHPHVVQPVKWINNTLCIYSLGNCVACQKGDELEKHIGGMIKMNIIKDNNTIKLKDIKLTLNYIYVDDTNKQIKVIPFSHLTDNELYNNELIQKEYSNSFILENINNYIDDKLKLSKENKSKFIKLDKRYGDIMNVYHEQKSHFQNITNMSELVSRYKKHLRNHDDYNLTFDKLEYEKSDWSDSHKYKTFIDEVTQLLDEFNNFGECYLSKYYIEKLEIIKKNVEYVHEYINGDRKLPKNFYRPSKEIYDTALKYLKENPLIDIKKLGKNNSDYERNISAKDVKKTMEDEIEKHGYDWDVELDDNLVPRMSVKTYNKVLINNHSNFSKVDINSLIRHEINTHVARKNNGLKTNLNLFLYGLHGAGKYDEGMAIYNSLDKSPKPKPNILFYISKKIVILKHIFDMSTDELVEKIMKLTNSNVENAIVGIIRAMRIVFWNKNYAASIDNSYLCGYEEIKKMDDSSRAELLKYNIGPDQLYDLNTIKDFLKINNFVK